MFTEEEMLFTIVILRERRRRTFMGFVLDIRREEAENKMVDILVDKLVRALPGKWWVQRHGGSTNHNWKTIFELEDFDKAHDKFQELKPSARRGGVSLVYRPKAPRLDTLEVAIHIADANDKERMWRKKRESQTTAGACGN
jgi:hypothetical protein